MSHRNKLKILNDPIYGFITIPDALIFDLIEHPYFQRLRRITQLGLTYLVYPGAYHTRFHHALGAMHLMGKAVRLLRSKGHEITPEEEQAVNIAILLHDIGHGPFSHALENSIVPGINHEKLSREFMKVLNDEFKGELELAIQIFTNTYHKKFLHQLISSQLDMDRLDYLRRDCFYTGVSEGQVNSERLITMLNVADDQLVVDSKGIYSVEKFIVARRLMYWQVYLHKTVLSAEFLLIKILMRAREVYSEDMVMPSMLRRFIKENLPADYEDLLPRYAQLDDYDIMTAIKEWQNHPDKVLSILSRKLLERKLLGARVSEETEKDAKVEKMKACAASKYGISKEEARYFVFSETLTNNAYDPSRHRINLLYKDGTLQDIASASDQLNISALTTPVTKNFLFFPKDCRDRR
ncbi:MAG TPA: phosphohydrolase [Cryomorphaceae bacterium]|nr:phosphohydrolase [Owenweeksia sp.]MBG00071.1 phosphohydrolase [Owenweeksia sp.]HAD97763.1 phosphohydrolase [Cryomorphaceae bacterium]HBF21808.1 phosphohydrolase [Cryomorphaceae bacterium]HCQ14749.1 phosphohydrolase [Cryomorphaceae bacterium]